MNLNKFEALGIGFSVAVMALALWLVRVDSNISPISLNNDNNQTSAVIVAGSGNRELALTEAFTAASDGQTINKLVIDDILVGDGEVVKNGSQVTVHYIGTLQNGQEFDNSYVKGSPLAFIVGKGMVIKGWDEGLIGMRVGGQRILVIPSELAYGKSGGGPIPPNANLVFAIELVSLK